MLVLERLFDPPPALETAQAEWRAAVARAKACKHDTRAWHHAIRDARRASTVAVRLEMSGG